MVHTDQLVFVHPRASSWSRRTECNVSALRCWAEDGMNRLWDQLHYLHRKRLVAPLIELCRTPAASCTGGRRGADDKELILVALVRLADTLRWATVHDLDVELRRASPDFDPRVYRRHRLLEPLDALDSV